MKINIRSGRKFLGGLLVCGVVSTCGVALRPGVARASGSGGSTSGGYIVAGVIVLSALANETMVLTSAVLNGVSAGKGERPSRGWLGVGYVTSTISIIGGAILMVAGLAATSYEANGSTTYGYPSYGTVSKVDGGLVGMGVAALALGGLGLGLTIWGSSMPVKSSPNLKLQPIVGVDGRRGFFAGAALTLAGF